MQLHHQFFRNLAQAISDGALAGVDVLVVGDDEPPLSNGHSRSWVWHGRVRWLHFKIREKVSDVPVMANRQASAVPGRASAAEQGNFLQAFRAGH